MNKRVKELPLNFFPLKKEVQKVENTFWYTKNRLNNGKDTDEKDLALFYVLLSEFVAFTESKQMNCGEKLLTLLGNEKSWKVLLGEFGKKVEYNIESRWIEVLDMTEKDWIEYDEDCNKKYLEGKK
jgi:hypothetical protein